jgi:hypothetical protein
MPLYDFNFDDIANPLKMEDMRFSPKDGDKLEDRPSILPSLPVDAKSRDTIWFDKRNIDIAQEIHEFTYQGYKTIDRGVKNFFSGIMVPTATGARPMQVRISGGDKPYLIWAQDLKYGRVKLPVMSIKREGEEFHPPLFSPAYLPIQRRFLDSDKTKMVFTYRPVPSLLKYNCSVWAEHKRDLEYILYQIRIRFNPEADFYVEDERIRANVFMKYTGMSVNIDDDVPADQRSNKRHDYSFTAEGFLPLPEKIVPTVLGRVTTLREGVVKFYSGNVLGTVNSKQDLPTINTKEI